LAEYFFHFSHETQWVSWKKRGEDILKSGMPIGNVGAGISLLKQTTISGGQCFHDNMPSKYTKTNSTSALLY
jgi:hypothetical protein